ncbi:MULTISPECIES: YvrJ family protein [Rummeliibacillus]|uniref:YvrJ family protein n=1 Tax=Rummeliibacillus TaxID=648802 RepID=UPI0011B5886F|nr:MULTISPECIES: YvrJ family protein [Rummeliibacillus]
MDQLSFEAIVFGVSNFGFPLVLAAYLLLRFEKKLESLTLAIEQLKSVVDKNK